jgi:hypothetical protein
MDMEGRVPRGGDDDIELTAVDDGADTGFVGTKHGLFRSVEVDPV